jgi:triosephosphate isomerase
MIVIANWKQNKNYTELKQWVDMFDSTVEKSKLNNVEIVIAPSIPFIIPLKMISQGMGYLKFASQNISMFENGAHTGETGAEQLKGIVEYTIIGHSERRKSGETAGEINSKIENALKAQIKPIVCFSAEEEFQALQMKFANAEILYAYEPANAISTAENSTGPVSADQVKHMVDKLGLKSVIYGGSVDENSIDTYLNLPFINGFLVGGASLDAVRFAKIVTKSA